MFSFTLTGELSSHVDMEHILQVEHDTIWCFEQEQSLAGLNVVTTIRMTVVKLQNGELLIYAPIAPTRCVTPYIVHFRCWCNGLT